MAAVLLSCVLPILIILVAPTFWPTPAYRPFEGSVVRADAIHYSTILRDGYTYNVASRSNVAFPPGYPLLARFVRWATGLQPTVALLIVSWTCLLGCCVLLAEYSRRGLFALDGNAWYVTVAFALFPATLFFRMPYSEPLFLFLLLGAFTLMQRGASPLLVALSIGSATAVRHVGVAALPAFLIYLSAGRSWRSFFVQAVALAPVACWGLLAYMAYLWERFDDPMAFAQTQQHWYFVKLVGLGDRAAALVALEPIWGYFDSSSVFFWERTSPSSGSLFGAPLLDRATWLFGIAMGAYGWAKRWLTAGEVSLVIGLLLIPYLTRGYEMAFFSQARFTSVAFPIYLVYGRILATLPRPVSITVLVASGFLLAAYTARFVTGHLLI
jgi:hypothetical protein